MGSLRRQTRELSHRGQKWYPKELPKKQKPTKVLEKNAEELKKYWKKGVRKDPVVKKRLYEPFFLPKDIIVVCFRSC
eukprot:6015876-Amphidinium_carterae.1